MADIKFPVRVYTYDQNKVIYSWEHLTEQQLQDDNNSYDMYMETLSMRANMQNMIS